MRIELIATDRQSVMLAVTPTNRLYGRPRLNRDNLFIPSEGSDQSEYFYIFQITF